MFKQLFLDGFSFENYQSIATEEEKKLIKEIQKNIKFSDDILEKIKKIEEDIYIVASVETWCPFARVFSITMNELKKINKKINLSFITYGRGTFDIGSLLKISEDDFVVPTAIILDSNFKIKNSFIAYPEIYKENGFNGEKGNYFNGKKTEIIINEILKKINLN